MKENDLSCPECGRFRGDHEEWCSLGRNWMTPGLKRWIFVIAFAIAIGLLLRVTATGATYDQWQVWRGAFEYLATSKGLHNANECTPYTIESDKVHPQRLRAYYRKGFTPETAFEDIGCDAVVFQKVWLKRLRQLVKAHRIIWNPRDEEAIDEWLWLEYFTEGKSPDEAVKAVADSGYMKGTK